MAFQQMIALYESVTGNYTFSQDGWQFEWGADTEFPDPIPYTTSLLMANIFAQTTAYDIAGVPCEPDSIFIICNSFPMNAFLLHDSLHASNFSVNAVSNWQNVVEKHGKNKVPDVDGADNNFFNLDYLIHPVGIWEPIGKLVVQISLDHTLICRYSFIATVGSDVWALAWMRPFWRFDDTSEESPSMLTEAFQSVLKSSCWQYSNKSEAYLHPGAHKSSIFPFSDEIATSFYPMIHKQFDGSCPSQHVPEHRASSAPVGPSINDVYRYFENSYGRWFDSDGDGVDDSYQYNTALKSCSSDEECRTGDYSIWATGNLLVGMLLPCEDLNYLRRLFRGEPFTEQRQYPKVRTTLSYIDWVDNMTCFLPQVESVSYPHVMVQSAQFLPPEVPMPHADSTHSTTCGCVGGHLDFTLIPGDNAPFAKHNVIINCRECNPSDCIDTDDIEITMNDNKYDDWTIDTTLGRIYIEAPGWDTDSELLLRFLVTFGSRVSSFDT